ncbi:MAG: GGDEF domain-containing phosphodiesterase [Lachnospiraceae bacterium]|nr:GGDEF domain-containing phosphodiesterase [Lachnospiraceae bacterium]
MSFFEFFKEYSEFFFIIFIVCFFIYSRYEIHIRERNVLKTREQQTGLLNEHACIEFLNELSDKNTIKGYAIVYFDIIRFGFINDRYGMDIGNIVLRDYARWLERSITKEEIVARQTGDRFIAVVLRQNLDNFLENLKEHLFEIEYEDRNYSINVATRSGIFFPLEQKMPGEEIISIAHGALNYGKMVKKGNVTYMTEKLYSDIKERKRFENDIPLAMANNEFKVYYQPKVNIHNKRLCGAEALVRWQHKGQMISPGKFIPMLEQNDLMCDMDFYMLRHLCADISKWITKGIVPPTISVNFSRRNLSNENAANEIDEIVNEYHVPKKMIEIEITETIDEFPISVLGEFVDNLHRLGYRVAVDDFGCGSSSLSLLREVTFDTLKIDKGFVDRAYAKDLTILNYIIKMAKALNVEVLAEGVERKEQLATLDSLGCDVIQGFYFDKPLTGKAFEERMLIGGYSDE